MLQSVSCVKPRANIKHIVGQDGVMERSLEATETMENFLEEEAVRS